VNRGLAIFQPNFKHSDVGMSRIMTLPSECVDCIMKSCAVTLAFVWMFLIAEFVYSEHKLELLFQSSIRYLCLIVMLSELWDCMNTNINNVSGSLL
jgi:hypothetical protein